MRKNRFKVAREDRGLTQAQLAAAAGCNQTSISQLERGGTCGRVVAERLYKVLGDSVSVAWMMGIGRPVTLKRTESGEIVVKARRGGR